MAERGIIFSAPMVRALLDGRKSQTRRLLKPELVAGARFSGLDRDGMWLFTKGCAYGKIKPPFAPGDRLYVREDHYAFGHWEPVPGVRTKGNRQKWRFLDHRLPVLFSAPVGTRLGRHHKDPATPAWHKRLARFMPRGLSRLTLTATDVRVQWVQEISEADAKAEGIIEYEPTMEDPAEFSYVDGGDIWNNARSAFAALWNSLHTKPGETWEANPWIVAVSFAVEHGNIDSLPQENAGQPNKRGVHL